MDPSTPHGEDRQGALSATLGLAPGGVRHSPGAPKSQRSLRFAIAMPAREPQKSLAISETMQSNAALRFQGAIRVRWKIASDLRFWAAISKPKTHSFCGNSGDVAPSTRKSLVIAIVRFWCAKALRSPLPSRPDYYKTTCYKENILAQLTWSSLKLQNNHFTKQIPWLASCKKGHTRGSSITKKIFWWN